VRSDILEQLILSIKENGITPVIARLDAVEAKLSNNLDTLGVDFSKRLKDIEELNIQENLTTIENTLSLKI
jgi:hypothetical protein